MDHSPDVSDVEEDGLLNSIIKEEAANSAVNKTQKTVVDAVEVEEAASASTDQEDDANAEYEPKKSSRRKRKFPADKDWQRTEEEEKLMHSLFGNKEKLLQKFGEDNSVLEQSEAIAVSRQPVWQDSDDEGLHADDVIDYERKGAPVVRKQGKYKVYLEQTFQHVLGTPAWAKIDRVVEDEDSDDEKLLRTVGHLAKPSQHQSGHLLPTTLQFKRMKDLNRATYAEGPAITGLEFHPTSSVALVTGKSGVATIYSIDGRKNEKLHGLQFDNFSIKSCRLTRSGTEAIFGGSKKFFYTYDLLSGETQRTFLPRSITKMSHFELSPNGRLISISGRFGEIHLLDSNSKELITTVKQEHVCSSMAFSADSTQLLAHSSDAEVTVFDLRMHRAMHRFNDEGCVNGSSIRVSPNGRLLATGSEQGVVNVYELDHICKSSSPKPIKTVFNLTTAITSTEFNHSSEILAIGSNHISDAIKLVHFPSGSVYANFPGQQGNVGKPNIVRFSPMSGYLAIGNLNKEVALYRLKHFSNY